MQESQNVSLDKNDEINNAVDKMAQARDGQKEISENDFCKDGGLTSSISGLNVNEDGTFADPTDSKKSISLTNIQAALEIEKDQDGDCNSQILASDVEDIEYYNKFIDSMEDRDDPVRKAIEEKRYRLLSNNWE